MRRVRPEPAKIMSFGKAIPALLGAPQGAVVDRQHQSARRGRGHRFFLAYRSLGPPLCLRELRVGLQNFLKTLRQPVSVLDGPREQTAGRGHQYQLSAGQPAIAFRWTWFGNVESLPGVLIHVVLAVDVPARGEAGELFVEKLDRLVGVDG